MSVIADREVELLEVFTKRYCKFLWDNTASVTSGRESDRQTDIQTDGPDEVDRAP